METRRYSDHVTAVETDKGTRYDVRFTSVSLASGYIYRRYESKEIAEEIAEILGEELDSRKFKLVEPDNNYFPNNLINSLVEDYGCGGYDTVYIESHIDENLERAMEGMAEREKLMVDLRYRKMLTFTEIGKLMNLSKQGARRLDAVVVGKLSKPQRTNIILTGIDTSNYIEEYVDRLESQKNEIYKSIVRELSESFISFLESGRKTECDTDNLPITELEISAKVIKSLHRNGIRTIGGLRNRSYAELMSYRNIGEKSMDQLTGELKKYGVFIYGKKEAR